MFRLQTLVPPRALSALALSALALLASGCQKGPPNQPNAHMGIAATALVGPYQPGDRITFRVTVSNLGTEDVASVNVVSTLGSHVYVRQVTCSPLGKAAYSAGDAGCYPSVALAKLAKGASVTLDITTSLDARAQGTITNTFSVDVFGGPAPVTASNQITVVDGRGGAYTAFTSDGQRRVATADFAGNTLSFNDNGGDVVLPFTLQAAGSAYLTAANAGFVAHRDLLAGTIPLDGGTPGFIAARNFVSSVAALDGRAFNTFEIDTPTGGAPVSHFQSALVSGSTMQVCADRVPHTLATCPAASLRHYDLTLAGDVFTGVDAADADTMAFQVAQSSGTLVLLRAEATAAGRVFQVGLSAISGVVPNVFQGGDTAGNWGNVNLNPSAVQENWTLPDGSLVSQYSDQITPIANAPTGVVATTVASGGGVYLAEDADIAILMGKPGGLVDGLLQVFAW